MNKVAAAAVAALLLLGGGAIALRKDKPAGQASATIPASERPTLALLTSLPLLFAEEFSIDGGGSPALARLDQRYNVVPIGVADAASLAGKHMLLMAHPRAQPAEALVELDAWVRGGGNLVLLADPRLDWHSSLPLGDPLRPPPFFADTGLLKHWGLSLTGPIVEGPHTVAIGRGQILAVSGGRLTASGACQSFWAGFVARCAIGRGRATVIADADFINVTGEGAIDGPTAENLDFLVGELARIEPRSK